MAKGDYVSVTAQRGDATLTKGHSVEVQGRELDMEFEKDGNIQWFVVREKTRAGTVTREMRFATDTVIAVEIQIREKK